MAANLQPIQSQAESTNPQTPAAQSWLEGGVAVVDFSGIVQEANDALLSWMETDRTRIIGQPIAPALERLSEQWIQPLGEWMQRNTPFHRATLNFAAGNNGRPAQSFAVEVVRTPLHIVLRLNSSLPQWAELNEGVWDEHLNNNSARWEMFMRLLRAEAQLDRLMHRWPCVIFSQRPDFSLQFVSPNIHELTGIAGSDWDTQPKLFWQLVHELDAPELQQHLKRSVQTGKDFTCTYRIRHSTTGRVAYILEHRQPTISHNGLLLGYEVVWLDVTRQTIAEKRLSTAAWKETLAVLTLGMAHDFRNIMAGIHSLSESYLAQVTETHPFHEGLGLIKKSSMQASQLVQRMINLHLGQTGERNYQDVNEFARDLLELVSKILPRRIHMQTELAPETLPVYADVVELRQLVINLLLNAADAMPQGGALILRTKRHTTLPELKHFKGNIQRVPCVCLTIQDTGCGIKQRHLDSIFDAFFTTKSKGSGLGLYNARIAVEKHNGAISVESEEGVGTSFSIWLPETDFTEAPPDTIETHLQNARRHSLLLVGQSGEMLDRTAELLRSNNFHVVLANPPETMGDVLLSNEYQFSGVLLLAEPNDITVAANMEDLGRNRNKLKRIIRLAGLSLDEVKSPILQGADLMLTSEVTEAEMIGYLENLLAK